MSHHRFHSLGTVPFSWENSPGISKVAPRDDVSSRSSPSSDDHESMQAVVKKLPPPPCTRNVSQKRYSIHVPLPPCPFQPPQAARVSFSVGHGDPFLAAYMVCTKSARNYKGKSSGENNKKRGEEEEEGKRSLRGWGGFVRRLSCKKGSARMIREDGIVRVSQVAGLRERDRLLERRKSKIHDDVGKV